MKTDNRIKNIYSLKLPDSYSRSWIFNFLKKQAIKYSGIKKNDTVLIFCCGPGTDFPFIFERIGKDGKIIAVDFSEAMLEQAKDLCKKNNWTNISFILEDITKFDWKKQIKYQVNAAICTLGLSIIPEYKKALNNIYSSVKNGGKIIIGDFKTSAGFFKWFNYIALKIASPYGGSKTGHSNSLNVIRFFEENLTNINKKKYLFDSYYIVKGTK